MRRLGVDMLLGRIGGAAFGRPMLGGVLGRVFSAPAVVRAAVVVPLISKLEPHGSGVHQHRFTFDIRLGLGLAAGAAILVGQSEDAKCMPKRKEKATVPEVQLEEVTAAASAASILSAPMATAYPLPQEQMLHAVDATPRSSSKKGRTTSRVHEAFVTDPADSSRCLCQSTENVRGGGVCNENIGKVPQTMWTHLKSRHPLHWARLKDICGDDAASASASTSFTAAPGGGCLLPCSAHVSYKQMVDALSVAPPATLSWAIAALNEAERRKEKEFVEGVMSEQ